MLSYAIVETGVCHSLLYLLLFVFGFAIASPQYCRKDSHGHKAGDELLQATAECLRQAVSSSGKVYRVGGDEFICIFNATDKDTLDMIKKINDNKFHVERV